MSADRPQRMCLFIGPTIGAAEVRGLCAGLPAELELLPPVQQGDILRLAARPPDVIGIIDGLFFQVPSVLHKEILLMLSQGVRVLGASSLGALRAAELDVFGMEGVGEVYRMYQQQIVDGDDEVAVLHTDHHDGFRALTEPLVGIRYNLRRARRRRLVSAATAAAVLAQARRLHFSRRTYLGILKGVAAPAEELEALRQFFRSEAVDIKRQDARALVQSVAARLRGAAAWPERPAPRLNRTVHFYLHQRAYVGQSAGGQHIPDTRVLALQKLVSPGLPRLRRRVALRCLAADEARERGLGCPEPERLLEQFFERRAVAPAARRAWLEQRALSADELAGLLADRALEGRLVAAEQAAHPGAPGRAAAYRRILAAAAERLGLPAHELLGAPSAQPGIPWEEPLLHELKLRGRFPAALETARRILEGHAAWEALVPGFSVALAPQRLEAWCAARWGLPRERLAPALAERGFTSYQEFLDTARLVYTHERVGASALAHASRAARSGAAAPNP